MYVCLYVCTYINVKVDSDCGVCFLVMIIVLAVEGIRAGLDVPDWLLVQFQERGSYRTEDVLEFLDWALEPAACPQESVVVMLDWFSGHLAPEIAELVAQKGHLLVFHGGGVTGLEQINETRLDLWVLALPYVFGIRLILVCGP